MMTMSNSVYCSFKRKGLHNWGFLNPRQIDVDMSDFDFDIDALEFPDMDLFLFDDEVQGG